jgi:hypothetical protein
LLFWPIRHALGLSAPAECAAYHEALAPARTDAGLQGDHVLSGGLGYPHIGGTYRKDLTDPVLVDGTGGVREKDLVSGRHAREPRELLPTAGAGITVDVRGDVGIGAGLPGEAG